MLDSKIPQLGFLPTRSGKGCQSFGGAVSRPGSETLPSLSEISLEADIYRDGQLDMPSDKQAKVRLPGQGRVQDLGEPSLGLSLCLSDCWDIQVSPLYTTNRGR